jgi:hypothetical protein
MKVSSDDTIITASVMFTGLMTAGVRKLIGGW